MKKSILLSFLVLTAFMVSATVASAYQIILDARGDTETYNGASFHEFTVADQESVSAGTGVIDPFLTIQKKGSEEGINSDAGPQLVLDTTRDMWNHSITVGDFRDNNNELLLDINEPNEETSQLLTQHELMIFVIDSSVGGAYMGKDLVLQDLLDLANASASDDNALLWDLDAGPGGDSQIELDYGLWQGSGQNIDMSVTFSNITAGFDREDFIYVYAQFGELDPGAGFNYESADGFEEYVLRTGGTPVPEPATMFLLGTGLVGVAGAARRKIKKNQA